MRDVARLMLTIVLAATTAGFVVYAAAVTLPFWPDYGVVASLDLVHGRPVTESSPGQPDAPRQGRVASVDMAGREGSGILDMLPSEPSPSLTQSGPNPIGPKDIGKDDMRSSEPPIGGPLVEGKPLAGSQLGDKKPPADNAPRSTDRVAHNATPASEPVPGEAAASNGARAMPHLGTPRTRATLPVIHRRAAPSRRQAESWKARGGYARRMKARRSAMLDRAHVEHRDRDRARRDARTSDRRRGRIDIVRGGSSWPDLPPGAYMAGPHGPLIIVVDPERKSRRP